MTKMVQWCQTRKLIVQRVCNLTIYNKPLDQDNSKFYSRSFIKLPTTFMLYDFSNEQLKIVQKFSLDRLLQLDIFAEGYYKFENTKVENLKKILKFLQQIWILCSYISSYRPNFIWGYLHHLKIQGYQNSRCHRLPRRSLRPCFKLFDSDFFQKFLCWWFEDECRTYSSSPRKRIAK